MRLKKTVSLMLTAIMAISVYGGFSQAYGAELPSGDPPFQDHIIGGVSPNGTTIDLFDYWITEQNSPDDSNGEGYDFIDNGINKGHALLFGNGLGSYNEKKGSVLFGDWNCWTENTAPKTGIVSDSLSEGYPKLDLKESVSEASLLSGRNGNESLAYLFDPDVSSDGKASYEDVKGLLQVDKDGYYYYNSRENYAVYYSNDNAFTLYEYPGVMAGGADTSLNGQFFPFNKATDVKNVSCQDGSYRTLMNDASSWDASLNHYFGMHMTTRFIQQYGGYIDENQTKAVTYEFSGDDDVWIFIDGVLVADLGGIHDKADVKIDFSNGKIYINDEEQKQTLGDILNTGRKTLTDNTYHTLDFFYLERGNIDSNMELKYNLVTIPESNLIKVDQIGKPVEGAEFTLYGAEEYEKNGKDAVPIATGSTDEDGGFVFLKADGYGNEYPITIDELYRDYDDKKDSDGNNLILVETVTPPGYRSVGDIGLYFYKAPESDEVMLLSNSIWDEGAYAMPKVTTTAPNVIRAADNKKVEVSLAGSGAVENPLMFAVVYQKQKDNSWLPVSGDPLNGWTVEDDSRWESVLKAAQSNPYIFRLASSGAYQVEVSNLPGDISKYYHIVGNEEEAEYTVAYYYTSADMLENASEENTWRIDSDPDNPQYDLDRVFSMDLYVTNLENQLIVQKVDDEGNTVNGAKFSLYKAEDITISDDIVSVKDDAQAYDSLKTGDITGLFELSGGGVFPTDGHVLEKGEYYLIETSAPYGYKLNDTAVHVIADDTGVYADAGTADDGVSVLSGAGSVMRSMLQFAVDDDVDITLNEIKAALASEVTYDNGSFEVSKEGIDWNSTKNDVLHLKYANVNKMLDYGLYDKSAEGTIDNLTLSTDTGWSKLLIRQCYQHDKNADVDKKTDLETADITALFSGTVTVRVANEKTGNLKISKTVTGDNAPDEEFSFAITLKDGNDPVSGSYDAKKGETDSTVTFNDAGKAEINLKAGESMTILGLPEGAGYTVEEKAIPEGFTADVTVEGDGEKDENNSARVSGTIQHSTSADAAVNVEYTNSFDGSTSVTLNGDKILKGRDIAEGEKYSFTISAGDDETETNINEGIIILPEQTAVAEGDGGSGTAAFSFGKITFKNEGTYKFDIAEVLPEGVSAEDPVSDNIRYDTHITEVTVKVTKNEQNILSAEISYDNKGNSDETDKAIFINAYEKINDGEMTDDPDDGDKGDQQETAGSGSLDDAAQTGDDSKPGFWMIICCIALLGMVSTIALNGKGRNRQ